MATFMQDLRYAVRSLLKAPAFPLDGANHSPNNRDSQTIRKRMAVPLRQFTLKS